jgi:hypothetical protein
VSWKDQPIVSPNIDDLAMKFVNRENAVGQLQKIHMFNLHRALNQRGVDWIVPICDNIFGLGKSEFAHQYVKKCSERTALKPASSGLLLTFEQFMSEAHTVKITFGRGEMRNEKTFEKVLVQKLQETLIPLFKVAPMCLFESYSKSANFLSVLISDVGPIFVALDEIGSAFLVPGMDDLERRDIFLKFCDDVL